MPLENAHDECIYCWKEKEGLPNGEDYCMIGSILMCSLRSI